MRQRKKRVIERKSQRKKKSEKEIVGEQKCQRKKESEKENQRKE